MIVRSALHSKYNPGFTEVYANINDKTLYKRYLLPSLEYQNMRERLDFVIDVEKYPEYVGKDSFMYVQ